MSGEPEQKRMKIDAGDSESKDDALNKLVEANLEQLDKVQVELNNVNDQASAEIIQIEKKYSEIRKPFFEKRHKFIEGIPNFWLTVFINHPATRGILTEDEEECLHYLTKVDVVEEFAEDKNVYSIKFVFDVNPFFENTELVKKFVLSTAGESESSCTATKIDWKAGKKLVSDQPRNVESEESFFEWFCDESDPTSDEIADIIKDDIWLNPLQYYMNMDGSSMGTGSDDELASGDDGIQTDDDDEGDLNE